MKAPPVLSPVDESKADDMRVYVGNLTGEQLSLLVSDLRSCAPWSVVADQTRICYLPEGAKCCAVHWQEGRLFGDALELLWWRSSESFRVRLTCSSSVDVLPGSRCALTLGQFQQRERTYYLMGKDDISIGGRLDYEAIVPRGRALLRVIEYRDESGKLVYYRYAGIVPEGSDDKETTDRAL